MSEKNYQRRIRTSDHLSLIKKEDPLFEDMYELFEQIGIFWHNTPEKNDLRTELYTFMMNRMELNSFYIMEYQNAKDVLDEFKANAKAKGQSKEEAYAAFLTDPDGLQSPPNSRLAHARQYVSNEFISLQLTVGGFASFGAKNYPGFIGGAYIEGEQAPYRTS